MSQPSTTRTHPDDRHKRPIPRRVLLLLSLGMLMAAAGCGDAQPTSDVTTEAGQTQSGFSSDLDALREVLDVPGNPVSVRWGPVALGGTSEGDRVPGPTDIQHLALIDYGDPAVTVEMVAEASTFKGSVPRSPWYPDDLIEVLDDSGFAETLVYEGVAAFGGNDVGVPVDAPRYALVVYDQDF